MHPFMHQISITHRCAMRYREQELADTGLGGGQTSYLITLFHQPGISQEELARRLNVNKSSVTRQLTVLEEKGYITRKPKPDDRRSMLVYPTEKALALQDRVMDVVRGWANYLTEDFTEDEKETLSQLMLRISSRAEEYMKGGEAPCAPSDGT